MKIYVLDNVVQLYSVQSNCTFETEFTAFLKLVAADLEEPSLKVRPEVW